MVVDPYREAERANYDTYHEENYFVSMVKKKYFGVVRVQPHAASQQTQDVESMLV